MRILVAPDKFKGSMTADQAARALALGASLAERGVEVDPLPMADGGEGTAQALLAARGGAWVEVDVEGPLGEPVRAGYARLADGATAVVEMALASGLALVEPSRRDVGRASTRGTGTLLRAAAQAGARRVVVCIGGSATNDGGAGLARALGYRLLDAEGREIAPGGLGLEMIEHIDTSGVDFPLDRVKVAVACDVDNPLCGPRGASAVFGPQKGADPSMVARLDAALGRLAEVIRRDLGVDVARLPGGGAAGGLGAGLAAFAGGRLEPGVELVGRAVGLDERLRGADLCLTGEGMLDASTAGGKVVAGVARAARRAGVPCLAVVGRIGEGSSAAHAEGVDACFSLCPGPMSAAEAIADAPRLLADAAEQVVRAFLAGRRVSHREH